MEKSSRNFDSKLPLYQRQNRYFYASTGVELEDYTATEKMIIIKIKYDKWSKYRVQFIGKGENRDKCGRLLKEDVGNPATYQIKGDEGYVRAKVIDSNGKVAWTQPVMIGKPYEVELNEKEPL